MTSSSFKPGSASSRPRGVTLIELLIVVGILTMLLGISLAMLRPVMKDMKVREAARMGSDPGAVVPERAEPRRPARRAAAVVSD